MKHAVISALAVAACLASAPAHATGDITCSGVGKDVSIDMLVGRLQVLSVLRAVIRVNDETWSTDQSYAQGTPVTVGQGFEDDRQLVIDFTDEAVSEVIGKLRAFSLSEGDDYMSGGVFSLKDKGVFLVDCSLRG